MLVQGFPEIFLPEQHFHEKKVFQVKCHKLLVWVIFFKVDGDQTAFCNLVSDLFHGVKLPKMQQPPVGVAVRLFSHEQYVISIRRLFFYQRFSLIFSKTPSCCILRIASFVTQEPSFDQQNQLLKKEEHQPD